VLKDYHHQHGQILPKEYFSDLQIDQGGQGAGTVFRVKLRVMGREFTYHMAVTEPVPGRMLVETDQNSGTVTTFTVTPTADVRQSQVQIATEWEAKPGVAGAIERLMTGYFMRRIYRQELDQLASFVQQKQGQGR
jgi:hypothetical protein